ESLRLRQTRTDEPLTKRVRPQLGRSLVVERGLVTRQRHLGLLAWSLMGSGGRSWRRRRSRPWPVFFRHRDRLQLRDDRVALILVPGRQMQFRPEIFRRFVLIEPAGDVRGALDEYAAGRTDVHGVEVEPILDLRCVGETEFLVHGFLLRQGIVGFDVERDVMGRAGAEAPASRRPLRLDVQIDDASGTGSRDLEAMVRAVDANLAEAERVDEKRFLVAHVANRQHSPEEAAGPDVPRDLRRRPRIPVVCALLDHFEEQSGWMPDAQISRAEPFLHTAVLGAMPIEVLFPERDRARRNGVTGAGQLTGPGATRLPRVRETRGDRADVRVAIAVVEVIDRNAPIHQDGLLDHALPEYLREEI